MIIHSSECDCYSKCESNKSVNYNVSSQTIIEKSDDDSNNKFRKLFTRVPTLAKATKVTCLVNIIGEIRAPELVWNSFNENVLQTLQCDLALTIGMKYFNTSNEFTNNAKYIWKVDEPEQNVQWEDKFDELHEFLCDNHQIKNLAYCESDLKYSWKDLYKKSPHPGHWIAPIDNIKGSGAIQMYMRQFLRIQLEKHNLVDKYDYMILTRSDHLYLCKHPNFFHFASSSSEFKHKLTDETNSIWIPADEGYGGYTDRHLVAESHLFIETLDIVNNIFNNFTDEKI